MIHEDAIKIGGQTKAPDYCFRIGGARKFFLEAKKPSVGLKKSPDPAYQLRRYAWSAMLPVSILTNFAEFAIYDCRSRAYRRQPNPLASRMRYPGEPRPSGRGCSRTTRSLTAAHKSRHDRLVALVERMLALHTQFAKTKGAAGAGRAPGTDQIHRPRNRPARLRPDR